MQAKRHAQRFVKLEFGLRHVLFSHGGDQHSKKLKQLPQHGFPPFLHARLHLPAVYLRQPVMEYRMSQKFLWSQMPVRG